MKAVSWIIALCAMLFLVPQAANASVVAKISLHNQRMVVIVDGVTRYTWAVSTARPGYRTPIGTFGPKRLEKIWYSSKYENAPMPHSVFFLGGYAIHGTNAVWSLGRPVSHGCVRLAPGNAALLFSLVRAHGMGATRIVVSY